MTQTNQQGAPEALRLADEWQRKTQREADRQNSAYDHYGMGNTPETVDPLGAKMAAELRRLHAENERLAALAGAQQPAPSAAAVVNPDPHAELRKTWQPGQRWQARSFRNGQWGPWTDAVASEPFWFPHQDYRRHPDDLAPQPSPTPQADIPAEQRALLDAATCEMQERTKISTTLIGVPTPQADSQPAPVLDERAAFAEHWQKNDGRPPITWEALFAQQGTETPTHCAGRYFLRETQTAWEAWQARAARAPADSVTAPMTPSLTDDQIEKVYSLMNRRLFEGKRPCYAEVRAMLAAAPTPPAQAADSVLEDAARLLRQILAASQDGDSDTHLSAHFVSRIETITKAGGAA